MDLPLAQVSAGQLVKHHVYVIDRYDYIYCDGACSAVGMACQTECAQYGDHQMGAIQHFGIFGSLVRSGVDSL